jgi:LPXTG-motif cell wall-anchored protein
MQRNKRGVWLVVCVCAALAGGGAVSAGGPQTSTSKEVKHFEVVSVDGNKVVVKGQNGAAQEITVPEDFRLDVDGRPVTVAELKPGMKGTATITTTTTVKPVYVTEVKNGSVMQVTGNSIIVRTANGIKMFNEGDVEKRGVKIVKNGEPVQFSDLHAGDKLTATIVTEGQPQVMTQRQVQASLSGAPAPAASAGTAAAAPAPTSGTAALAPAAAPRKKLPKTASSLPAVGLAGIALIGVGCLLTARRRMMA